MMIPPPPPSEPERPPVIIDLDEWERWVAQAATTEVVRLEGGIRLRQIKHPRQGVMTGIPIGDAVLVVHGTLADRRDLRRLTSWAAEFGDASLASR